MNRNRLCLIDGEDHATRVHPMREDAADGVSVGDVIFNHEDGYHSDCHPHACAFSDRACDVHFNGECEDKVPHPDDCEMCWMDFALELVTNHAYSKHEEWS